MDIAFSYDGHWLASASVDATARLWDLTAPNPATKPLVLSGHETTVWRIAFSSNGQWLATSAGEKVRLWDFTAFEPAKNPIVLVDQIEYVTSIAFSKDGLILGVCDIFLHDNGAYDPYGLTVPINTQCTLLGPYRVPVYYTDFKVIFTNKMIVTPYRGAGRQQAVFVMERMLDIAAKELGIDIMEIRRRNFIRPEAIEY